MICKGEIVLILAALISTSFGQDIKCPFVDDLQGCKCFAHTKSLVCDQTSKITTDLPDITGLEVLTINGTDKDTIKIPDSYTSLKELTLENNTKLTTIDWNKKSDKIVINNNPVFDLDAFLSAGSASATRLQIYKQKLTELKPEHLDKFPELVSINVRSSQLKTLSSGLLKGRAKLGEVALPSNEIDTIAGSLEVDKGISKTINLEINKITAEQLAASGIDKSQVQVNVYAGNNDVQDFTETHFKAISDNDVVTLYLDNNPIHCKYNDIEWIFNDTLVRDHILHPQCVDYNNLDLFTIEQCHFVDGPPCPTSTVAPTTVTTKEPTTEGNATVTETPEVTSHPTSEATKSTDVDPNHTTTTLGTKTSTDAPGTSPAETSTTPAVKSSTVPDETTTPTTTTTEGGNKNDTDTDTNEDSPSSFFEWFKMI